MPQSQKFVIKDQASVIWTMIDGPSLIQIGVALSV